MIFHTPSINTDCPCVRCNFAIDLEYNQYALQIFMQTYFGYNTFWFGWFTLSAEWETPLFFKKKLDDASLFCGATDTPVLDFWWRLPWVSKPEWIPWMLSHLCDPQIHFWCNTCWLKRGQHGHDGHSSFLTLTSNLYHSNYCMGMLNSLRCLLKISESVWKSIPRDI